MSKKCSTAQRFIRTEMTTYRIGTLVGNSERACGIFFPFTLLIFKYETIVSRNGLSLGYSEQDTSNLGPFQNSKMCLILGNLDIISSTWCK